MPQSILRYAILLVVLILAQVLICNHIMLFGVAMPIVFIYFLLTLPMSTNPKLVLTLGFLSGFLVDLFADTPGVNALSCTVIAGLRRPVFHLYSGNDEMLAGVIPSISSLGFAIYAKYLVSLVFLYCLMSFSLEYFTFAYFGQMTGKVLASTLLSSLLLAGIDGLTGVKHRA